MTHLVRLVHNAQEVGDYPALVLITSGSGNQEGDLRRARALGAQGVWTEPFKSGPLAHISRS